MHPIVQFKNTLFIHVISKNLRIKIHKTVILPAVLYGCETWHLTFRGEQILRVLEVKGIEKTT
jgi:hypothetical protein